ncbi:SLC13 family permease [Adlercreutzia faecimuris]|uniref:Anion permease n=1 Tax=Adlercreutzia faecimuris TaxID=2897341 RepID=A0ABS9WEC2_9ACTN|nr:SLC13 family permease [Adlercreutzia sp. JBNU-10]MCI2241219.1 anion permease [Adlercreutzia sp. JBNU-10]
MKQKSMPLRLGIMLVGLAAIALAYLAPAPAGLTSPALTALVVFLVAIVFWVTEVMPIAITGWAMVGILPLLGVLTPDEAWAASINNAIIFYLCCFAFACFIGRSSIATRLTGMILRWAGTSSSRVLLGFMAVTALISSLMDNLPLCAVMLPIAYGVLDANDTPLGRKSPFAKCLAIGIPWAAAIGGMMTPAGCIINVLTLSLLEQSFGLQISFVQWMALGIPATLILIPVGWLALTRIFKPEALSQQAVDAGIRQADELPAMPRTEIAGVVVMLGTLVVWVAGSWVPALNTTVVSLVALGLMFFPGVDAIKFDDFLSDSPWGMMLLMMAVNVLVAGLIATGAIEWLVAVVMAPMTAWPLMVTMVALSVIACLLHNVIPAGPACAGLIAVPFATIIVSMGGNLAAVCAMVAWWSAISLMLPLDGVPLLSYANKRKYFSFGDMLKVGWAPSVVLVIITVTLTPATCALLGLA